MRDLPDGYDGPPASLSLVLSGGMGEGLADSGEADVSSLARAISASPVWEEMPGAMLVVRTGPRPALGVMGSFDEAAQARLAGFPQHLAYALSRTRYVSYAQAESDCELLAERLVERFGREELHRFRFTAIPRGGFIVLGMLSYALGLGQEQFESSSSPETPLVVVDDCAISGSRFGRFLGGCGSQEVIFAHLYSHPDLRASIENSEPAVVACIGACNLHDHAPESLGDDYDGWRKRWETRDDGHRYWRGQPEHLVFPWNEPDTGVWNSVIGRTERAWNIAPPELCLKNRPAPGTEPVPVQMQSGGAGPLRPSQDALFGEFEGQVLMGNTETDESFALSGVGADMWKAIVEHGSIDAAATALCGEYQVDEDTLRGDLAEFVDELLSCGVLEWDHATVAGR